MSRLDVVSRRPRAQHGRRALPGCRPEHMEVLSLPAAHHGAGHATARASLYAAPLALSDPRLGSVLIASESVLELFCQQVRVVRP